jgi:hypothetical protein
MDLQRIALKWFARDPAALENLEPAVEVFHSWIQEDKLTGLPIDVADYSHVPAGPSMMLVGHECDYVLDHAIEQRAGFAYSHKRLLEGSLEERLTHCAAKALAAAQLVEADDRLPGMTFAGEELLVISNDRLLAPNTDEGAAELQPAFEAFAQKMYGADATVERLTNDPRQRLTFVVKATSEISLGQLALPTFNGSFA